MKNRVPGLILAILGKNTAFRATPNSGMENPNSRTEFLFYVNLYVNLKKSEGNFFFLTKVSINVIPGITHLISTKSGFFECKNFIQGVRKSINMRRQKNSLGFPDQKIEQPRDQKRIFCL
jgi:hypothetical protein